MNKYFVTRQEFELFLLDHSFENITNKIDKSKGKKEFIFIPTKGKKDGGKLIIFFNYETIEVKSFFSNIFIGTVKEYETTIKKDMIIKLMALFVCVHTEKIIYEIGEVLKYE